MTIVATLKQKHHDVLDSVDHDLRLKADHGPRLDRWTVVQREQFVIYCDYFLPWRNHDEHRSHPLHPSLRPGRCVR
jgi:hypothetical protein